MKKEIKNTVIFDSEYTESDGDLQLTAKLKSWDSANLNGEAYKADSYDEFINDYYVKNGYEIPFTVQHGVRVEDIIGKVIKIDKKDDGLYVTCTILKNLPNFERVKTLIDAKILRGVSDEGFAEGYWSDSERVYHVEKACILAVSLVTTPAEPQAKTSVKTKNLIASGFGKGINKLLKHN